jgi:hypothetical protein
MPVNANYTPDERPNEGRQDRSYRLYCEEHARKNPDSRDCETREMGHAEMREFIDREAIQKLDFNSTCSRFSNSATYINHQWQRDSFYELPNGRVAVMFYRVSGCSYLLRIFDDFAHARAYSVPMPRNIYLYG